MRHENPDKEVEFENTTPVKIIPLGNDFKEELYKLYKVYRPEIDQNDYFSTT
jgi:hypothetical protein